ncbi:hypothetical protein JAAARDRAFT_56075 [Jaapia argillacea MUCL 33604]|uniref:Uncharacterized protein n=1 Tax=Jaapia argillacea MUCL 33604 TaxID=933084 RepID=A0A067PZ33_9AGAM|nr:hypothetical protein JAAARDRAFT_56075 [Jaapia argillacea MUCL 33604]
MKFFAIVPSLILAAVSGLSGVFAQSSDQVISDIQMVTTVSASLNTMVSQINIVNVLFQGPQVASTLTTIVQDVDTAITHVDMPNPVPFPDSVALDVVDVLNTFVTVHQELLSTLIGQHGLLSLFGFAEPIRVALVSIEGVVDTYARALINVIPTEIPAAMGDMSNLDISLNAAITVYS